MSWKTNIFGLGQCDKFWFTWVIGRHCPLESGTLRCLYTKSSASPTTGSLSGTPVSLCCPASLAFRLQSVRYPRIFAPLTWFSSLRTLRRHMVLGQGWGRGERQPPICFRLENCLTDQAVREGVSSWCRSQFTVRHLSGRFLSTSSFTRFRTSLVVCHLSSQVPSCTLHNVSIN